MNFFLIKYLNLKENALLVKKKNLQFNVKSIKPFTGHLIERILQMTKRAGHYQTWANNISSIATEISTTTYFKPDYSSPEKLADLRDPKSFLRMQTDTYKMAGRSTMAGVQWIKIECF